MIHDAADLPLPGRLRADLCVIGSGPGGATVAARAAEAGLKVVMLEAGALTTPGQMNQREEDMLPRLLWYGGNQTTADRHTRVLQGRGVGGSSLHNLNLCKRIPDAIRDDWARRFGLEHLAPARWEELYARTEGLLAVEKVAPERWNAHNRMLERGCQALGWRGGGLAHNRTGCIGSGFCEVGCAYDAKNNALKVFVPRLVAAGGVVLSHAQAIRVRHDGRRVNGVLAVALDPTTHAPLGRITIEAPRVCLSASATGTAALLHRSSVPDPHAQAGRTLRIHPAVIVAGEFDEPIEAWRGIPQTYECTEHLDLRPGAADRTWIVPVFGHPVGVATMIPGHAEAHRDLMRRLPHLGALTAMLHDHTAGRVRSDGDLGLRIDYALDADDRAELARGLSRCARLLQAAGAKRVVVVDRHGTTLGPADDPDVLAAQPITPGEVDVSAVHPMGTAPMSDDPRRGVVASDGRHHQLAGLWVADGSLFPTSIGVPPQVSIYALAQHVADHLVGAG
ncbi:MAG: GMC family oxidoreductase [Myxococcales bacterium]|nr:GMC family oxidoreductase [Myxococcales bacterium]